MSHLNSTRGGWMDSKLSLVMIVKDEERALERCLKSIHGIVDEIIMVDTGSTDNTVEIAKSFGANVYDFQWVNDFSEARNFGLSKASHNYRLILDADEYIIKWDSNEINKLIQQNEIGIITRIDEFKQNGEIKQTKGYLSRVIPPDTYYTGAIHEQVDSTLNRVRVAVEIGHDGYLYEDKAERNLSILYKAIEQDPNDSYMLYQLAHTLFVSKHSKEAHQYYQAYYKLSKPNESYRCGAIVDYLYNLIELGQLEEGLILITQEEKRYSDSPDFYFVCGHFFRELVLSDINKYIQFLPRIETSFLKCLEIGETTRYDSVVGTGSYQAAYNLGAWYEVVGEIDKAKNYYNMAATQGYREAIQRLSVLQ